MDQALSCSGAAPGAVTHRLAPLLAPRSIALVGASPREGSVGNQMVRALRASGFGGAVHLINPRYDEIEGVSCLSRLGALEAPPDLAVIGVSGSRVEAVVDEAIALGAGAMVLFDACHGCDESGRPVRDRIRDKMGRAGLPVCGGNAMGFFDIPGRCHVSFYSARHLKPGGITLIAHSGSVFTVLSLNDPRYRFDLVVSSGQEIGATLDEYIDYALTRPTTRVIALFMETARRPEAFAVALAKAAARGVPVVVCKVGRTAESARVARSHSGALAGNDAAYDALLDQHGAIRVDTVDQLMNTALLLSQGRPAGSGGLGLLTDSGGLREVLIDRTAGQETLLAGFTEATRSRLGAILPETMTVSNPLDVAGQIDADFDQVFRQGLEVLAVAPEVALLGYEFDGRDDFVYDPRLSALAETLPGMTSKPCFAYSSFANAHNRDLADRLADAGLPLINGLDEMLKAASAMLAWRDRRAAAGDKNPPPAPPDPEAANRWRQRLEGRDRLGEAEGLCLLSDFGVPAIPHRQIETRPALLQAAEGLGFPVALKTAAASVDHKTEQRGVTLNLTDNAALEAAYRDLQGRLGPLVILQPMAPAGIELALGCVVDPEFGPLVMVSAGGTLIELLRDRVFALAPFGPGRVRRLIDRLALRPLLDGLCGAPPVDLDSLSQAVAAFSVLCFELREVIGEVDVNPVIAGATAIQAVDVLVTGRKPRRDLL